MAQILPITTTPVVDEWETNREYHNSLLDHAGTGTARAANVHVQESKNAPLFTVDAARKLTAHIGENPFPQYCLLGEKEKTYNVEKPRKETEEQDDPSDEQENSSASKSEDKRLFINMNAPYSAFLCGSQGSGKSHTLSCMLEGALKESKAGKLKQPMAGLVFHYDKPSSSANHQACEAAYLCSTGIPVRVLVPMSSIPQMEQAYANLPGLPAGAPKPVVCPFLLREEHLNVTSMMTLMKVDADQKTILYMEVVFLILRELSIKDGGAATVNFDALVAEVKAQKLEKGQSSPLELRLKLLKALMEKFNKEWLKGWKKRRPAQKGMDIWSFEPGTLTIIDLSDPWINGGAACALFDVCLHLFQGLGPKTGKIVALDEAHKFMTSTDQSSVFTESLLMIIREQRHSGMRVVIATQEPTISPKLLDLCSMTIVHRFTSPDWLQTLKARLAGVATPGDEDSKGNLKEIFDTIVHLTAGKALVFSPSAMVYAADPESNHPQPLRKLGSGYIKVQIRKRLTADGGKSVMAV